jgi:hypothetical protein
MAVFASGKLADTTAETELRHLKLTLLSAVADAFNPRLKCLNILLEF